MSDIHYLSCGDGTPDVLVIHGAGSSAAALGRLGEALLVSLQARDADRQIRSLSLAGYGSTAGDTALPIIEQHLDVLSQAVGGRACHLVGHSMGGFLALEFARREPQRVASLSLIEPMALGVLDADLDADAIDADRALIDAFAAGVGDGSGIAHFVAACSGAPFDTLPERAREHLVAREAQLFTEAHAVSYFESGLDAYAAITAKTLLLCGSDSLLPAVRICERLASLDACVGLETIAGAKHMDVVRTPERYAPAIADHLV